jgi:hypothetical protein
MSCVCCGGILAAELAAAMDQLVCEMTIFTGPHCHCNVIDGSMWACLLPEEKATAAEALDDRETSEKERL